MNYWMNCSLVTERQDYIASQVHIAFAAFLSEWALQPEISTGAPIT